MGKDTLTDGKRIGQLLASEIHGHERGAIGTATVVEADTDAEATEDGTFAYAIDVGDSDRIAEAYIHPDRLRIEFLVDPSSAAEAGRQRGLRTRPKAVDPPRTLVFVESGAEVKPALGVIRAVVEQRIEDRR